MSTDRDRDERGQPRSNRPRDELGRPLPLSGGIPEDASPPHGDEFRGAEHTLEIAERLLRAGQPFQAHEVFENAWKSTADPERELWRGLAQLAVGVTHRLRGNSIGADRLLTRGRETLAPFEADPPHGIAVASVRRWAVQPTDALPPLRTKSSDMTGCVDG